MSVSVLCSVRNGGDYLSVALSSVLEQSYEDLRLIVVNDSSVDDTKYVLRDIASKDDRVTVIYNDYSHGLTRSLNKALEKAETPWIARIDHDDVWHLDKLARQMAYIDANPEIGLLGTSFQEMNEEGANLRSPVLPLCQTDEDIRWALYRFNPFFHSSIIARRDLVQAVGGYNEKFLYAQDYELWVRLAHRTSTAILPETLCFRRVSKNNISVQKERAQRLNALKAKILWARLNGVKLDLLVPILRDLSVVLAPHSFKAIVRSKLLNRKEIC